MKIIKFCAYFIFAMCLGSCNPYFYSPSSVQTPLFREKGESQLSAHYGGGKVSESYQIQGAAAIDSHLSVMGAFYKGYGELKENFTINAFGIPFTYNNTYLTKIIQGEASVGYFKVKSKNKSKEWYMGLCYGEVQNNYLRDYTNGNSYKIFPFEVKTNFIKPFIQRNVGFRTKYFDIIYNNRLALLRIGRIREYHKTDDGFNQNPDVFISDIKENPKSFLLESGLTLRFGNGPLRAQVHVGTSLNLINFGYYQENYIISFGMVYKPRIGWVLR